MIYSLYSHRLISLLIASLLFAHLSGCASSNPASLTEDYSKRTFSIIAKDNTIRAKVQKIIKTADEKLKTSHISITVFNRVLLITGQVPDQQSKDRASTLTKPIRHIERIHNELTISKNSTFGSRTNDGLLSTKVSSRLLFTKGISSGRIKIVIEHGVLYLLGSVTKKEAQNIIHAMQKVKGLKRIVKVFTYILEK